MANNTATPGLVVLLAEHGTVSPHKAPKAKSASSSDFHNRPIRPDGVVCALGHAGDTTRDTEKSAAVAVAIPPREYMAHGFRRPPTRSGTATLIPLDDADVPNLAAGDLLVAEFGAGFGPVEVVAVRTGVVDLQEKGGVEPFAVPVLDCRVLTGIGAARTLAYDPADLCRVASRKGQVRP